MDRICFTVQIWAPYTPRSVYKVTFNFLKSDLLVPNVDVFMKSELNFGEDRDKELAIPSDQKVPSPELDLLRPTQSRPRAKINP